jgi:thiamine kinase-like enzyme
MPYTLIASIVIILITAVSITVGPLKIISIRMNYLPILFGGIIGAVVGKNLTSQVNRKPAKMVPLLEILAFMDTNQLLNLETTWIEEDGPVISDFREVQDRLGKVNKDCSFLSGGLSNHNYDLGDNRILRVFKRSTDTSTIDLESNLNDLDWESFCTAKTLERGPDYLVQRKLLFSELEDNSTHGSVSGIALGEIHNTNPSIATNHNKFLSSLFSIYPLSDLISKKLVWALSSKKSILAPYREWISSTLLEVISENSEQINSASEDKVLLHGDCKPLNIKKSKINAGAVVFDWEFSFVGPRLVDIGHFLRWGASDSFIDTFISSYHSITEVDISGSLFAAKLIDLVNLSFQIAKSIEGSARENDILDYFETIVSAETNANKPLQRTINLRG